MQLGCFPEKQKDELEYGRTCDARKTVIQIKNQEKRTCMAVLFGHLVHMQMLIHTPAMHQTRSRRMAMIRRPITYGDERSVNNQLYCKREKTTCVCCHCNCKSFSFIVVVMFGGMLWIPCFVEHDAVICFSKGPTNYKGVIGPTRWIAAIEG